MKIIEQLREEIEDMNDEDALRDLGSTLEELSTRCFRLAHALYIDQVIEEGDD